MFYRDRHTSVRSHVTVREAHLGDDAALVRLAALDSGPVPERPALVAESDARILAALPFGSGRPVADPFEPTAELVALLELRRRQLDSSPRRRSRPLHRLRRLLGARPARA
jgi:hypothetical protein